MTAEDVRAMTDEQIADYLAVHVWREKDRFHDPNPYTGERCLVDPTNDVAWAFAAVDALAERGFRVRIVDNTDGAGWDVRMYKYPEMTEIRWICHPRRERAIAEACVLAIESMAA